MLSLNALSFCQMTFDELIVYSDGASLGNPGKAGVGVLLYDREGILVKQLSQSIGRTTNNVAEYAALVFGLEEAIALGAKRVKCFLDSELVVRQLEGTYKVRDHKLAVFYAQVQHLRSLLERTDFLHICREKNRQADRLAKEAARGKRE